MLQDDPSLANVRRLSVELDAVSASRTDRQEPIWPNPYTESVDPKRAKDRSEKLDPKLAASRIENELPNRDMEYTDGLEPIRE